MSLFGVNFLMLFDPISLISCTTSVTIFPALDFILTKTSAGLYRSDMLAGPVNNAMKGLNGILVFGSPKMFNSARWIILLFISVVSLNALGKRFWCCYRCPLGGFLGLIGRIPLYWRKVEASACVGCLDYAAGYEMDAVTDNGAATDAANCHCKS